MSYRGHLRVVPPSAPFAERYPDGMPAALRAGRVRGGLTVALYIVGYVGVWVGRKLGVLR